MDKLLRMATLPKPTKCEALRCQGERVTGSAFCVAHGGKPKQTAQRRENNAPYKTAAWESIRAHQLTLQPLCQGCKVEGRIVPAAHVDHVIPWRSIGPQAFRRNLFQSLCIAHHSTKTHAEGRGVFIHYTDTGPIEYTKADWLRLTAQN